MNVRWTMTTVMKMRSVLTLRGVLPAFATLAILAMGSSVQVSGNYFFITFVYLMNCLIQPVDVNECELGMHICNSSANCTDTDGSFNCTCREGFEGDGFNCTGKFYYFQVNFVSVLT